MLIFFYFEVVVSFSRYERKVVIQALLSMIHTAVVKSGAVFSTELYAN